MPFRLRSTETVADGLRRLAREELKSISTLLDRAARPQDEAIHEIRKSVKKTRAILRVVRADKGSGLAKSAKRLHAINSRLSPLRDADVMLETLDTLRTRDRRTLNGSCFARLHRQLSAHRRTVMKAARRQASSQDLRRSVRKVRQTARHWKFTHRQFGSLAAALRLSHDAGRRALARARKRQQAADFHEWRKHIKALWYELRLVVGAGARIRRDVKTLHLAEVWLGTEHDIVVLCDELSKDVGEGDSRIDLDRIRLVGDRYRLELRTKAAASTRRIYARASRDYVKSVKREWERWCRRHERGNGV
jgi:CHAD domain-containing protein